MTKLFVHIHKTICCGIAMLAAAFAAPGTASAASVKASMDSSQIIMGNITTINLTIVEPAGSPAQLLIDKAAFPKEVETVDWLDSDTADLKNGIIEIKRSLVVQSFDSGVYVIPPFLLVNGPDTVRSNELTLKVNPVDVSHLADVHPMKNVADFESKWYDFLPDWLTDYWGWYLFALLVIAGGICGYLILTKKVDVNILPQKKRLPPDTIALNRLEALKEAQLWERGQEKEYYTRLIDILRDYLQERFGINAMEMTSTQILRALSSNEQTKLPNRYMKKVVEIADYVKFAKVRPMPDDNVQSLRNAVQFVEETRPVVEEPQEPASGADALQTTVEPDADNNK